MSDSDIQRPTSRAEEGDLQHQILIYQEAYAEMVEKRMRLSTTRRPQTPEGLTLAERVMWKRDQMKEEQSYRRSPKPENTPRHNHETLALPRYSMLSQTLSEEKSESEEEPPQAAEYEPEPAAVPSTSYEPKRKKEKKKKEKKKEEDEPCKEMEEDENDEDDEVFTLEEPSREDDKVLRKIKKLEKNLATQLDDLLGNNRKDISKDFDEKSLDSNLDDLLGNNRHDISQDLDDAQLNALLKNVDHELKEEASHL